ncbi:MAG: hypothetical protein HGB17_09310, partial [Syntrophobacteraceae bacterium]|nr:hypothetical protein [Syntrophobacteraceae bacterium]
MQHSRGKFPSQRFRAHAQYALNIPRAGQVYLPESPGISEEQALTRAKIDYDMGVPIPAHGMSRCECCPLNRRAFIAKGGVASLAALGALTLPGVIEAAAAPGKTRIRIVYVAYAPVQPRPTWPNIGYDFVPVMKRLESMLAKQYPEFD